VQTCGRAARNLHGRIIMYADVITRSMQQAIDETDRRRRIQESYNRRHQITPQTIKKEISSASFGSVFEADPATAGQVSEPKAEYRTPEDIEALIRCMEAEMHQAAGELDFERAAGLRDQIRKLKEILLFEF